MTPSAKREPLVKLDDIEIRGTELGYVTAVNLPTRTFFLQLCKFENEELNNFNDKLNEYSEKLANQDNFQAPKVGKGEIVIAKWAVDNRWYRALILCRDKETKTYSVLFVDYGNIETISGEHLILAEPTDLPEILRGPFGIYCFMEGAEVLSEANAKRYLDCISGCYIMVKKVEQQTPHQLKVRIPKNAYNTAFWFNYESNNKNTDSSKLDT